MAGQPSSVASLDSYQTPFDHPRDKGYRIEQLRGLLQHRLHLRAPVADQLSGDPDVIAFVDVLEHQSYLLDRARHTPFKGH